MSFVRVQVAPDTLDEENRKFVQRPLEQSLFLNSVPKSGSHLLRNIIRMFVPVEQQYQAEFIQHQLLRQHAIAFDKSQKLLSWGHMMFTDTTAVPLTGIRQILLVRDPYDWVLARARFLVSGEFQGGVEYLKGLSVDTLLNLMIFGIYEKAPPLAATYMYNAIAWLGTGAHLVRYEDLVAALGDLESAKADRFFAELLDACGIERPDDWRERVRVGSDRRQSGTARENLTGVALELPSELPSLHKRLVDYAAPGVRSILGYE
jgi:hypothetical protein